MAKTRSRRTKRFMLPLVAILMLCGAGAAFAYWTATGTGEGSAETGTSTEFTITSADAVGTIAPGSAGQTVEFTVTNPGPGIQTLSDVTVQMADAAGVEWVPTGDCDIADYTATITTAPTLGVLAVDAGVTGTATVTLDNDTLVNQDDCKNQTVPLYFVAS
jgi:hypothetical protein